MREIKFRFMFDDWMKYWWFRGAEDYLVNDLAPRMQYTWLKDKNWTDIYEGDVVDSDIWSQGQRVVSLDFNDDFSYLIQEYQVTDCLEIIWNIYENPDLLPNN
jgi:hypothetical protein